MNMKIGYMKNGETKEETLEDVTILNQNKVDNFYKENKNCKENLSEALRVLTKGDTLIVPKLKHIASNSKDYLKIVKQIIKKEASLLILDSPIFNITKDSNTKELLSRFIDLDNNYRSVRTREGVKRAKERGITLGRHNIYKERESEIIQLYNKPTSATVIAQQLKIPPSTVHRIIKTLTEERKI